MTIKKYGYILAVCLVILTSCVGKKPIKIGFTASLTGKNASLGIDGRDGAILAVETINAAGGVNGQPLELVIKDDLGTPEGAIAADRALIEADVTAIIGHMTSETTISGWQEVKDSGMVFISPTASTPLLAGLKDNFFRLIVVNAYTAATLAQYAYKELELRKIVIFFDRNNLAFTSTYRDGFSVPFMNYGGEITATHEFSSSEMPDLTSALLEARADDVDGILILASARDTAFIAQQAHLANLHVQILTSTWAFTDDLIQNGGQAIENIITVVSHDESDQSPAYTAFKADFVERFKRTPNFGAGYGYEAVIVLANALEKTKGNKTGLAEALLETKDFEGIHGTININEYGDVIRTLYLLTIENGEMKTLHTMNAIPNQ